MYCKEKWRTAGGKDPLFGHVDGFQIDPKGNTAQFSKESQQKIMCKIKVSKPEEYCMYFPVWKLPSWCKRFAVTRRRNCAVLPYA